MLFLSVLFWFVCFPSPAVVSALLRWPRRQSKYRITQFIVSCGQGGIITMLLRRGIGNTETRKLFTDAFFRGRFWPPKPSSASASHFGIVSMDGHQIGRPVRMHT